MRVVRWILDQVLYLALMVVVMVMTIGYRMRKWRERRANVNRKIRYCGEYIDTRGGRYDHISRNFRYNGVDRKQGLEKDGRKRELQD